MAELNAQELEALEDSKHLIRYAAENRLALSEATVLTLEQARDSSEASAWNSTVAGSFWKAFSDICSLVNPVMVGSIYANIPTITRSNWRVRYFHARPVISLSERTAQRYMSLLVVLLFLSIFLSYAVNSAQKAVSEVDKVLSDETQTVDLLLAQIREFEKKYDPTGAASARKFPWGGDVDQLMAIDKMQKTGTDINRTVATAGEELGRQILLVTPHYSSRPFDYADTSINGLRMTIDNFYASRNRILRDLPRVRTMTELINYALLPILLGAMGACAFVVRAVAEQIATTTFSKTSSIRHSVRLILGALAGVILGFGGFLTPATTGSSTLSAAALSFIAGYAVEPVFSLIDKISSSFRMS